MLGEEVWAAGGVPVHPIGESGIEVRALCRASSFTPCQTMATKKFRKYTHLIRALLFNNDDKLIHSAVILNMDMKLTPEFNISLVRLTEGTLLSYITGLCGRKLFDRV